MNSNWNLPYCLFCLSLYLLSTSLIYQNALENIRQNLTNHETTLLITAHPDDEVMFFGPIIINKLLKQKAEKFYILCVTTGNEQGLGEIRKKELIKSAEQLGLIKENIKILDDTRWLDGSNQIWKKTSLQKVILNEALSKNITEIITFDNYGVSGHTNHINLYQTVISLKSKLNFVKILTLKSINLFQKYLAFLDFPIFYLFNQSEIIYLINFNEYLNLLKAFNNHNSQIVWFRKIYSIFSKYMFINIYEEI